MTTNNTVTFVPSNTNYSSFFAQPYDLAAKGFYFSTYADYLRQAEECINDYGQPVEEFEIQPNYDVSSELFNACKIDQSNLEQWFDEVDNLHHHQRVALFYLMDNGICLDLDAALLQVDDVSISEGTLEDAATELFDECYLSDIPEHVRNYIDYKAFAHDCQVGGDMCEFTYQGCIYTCTNANSL